MADEDIDDLQKQCEALAKLPVGYASNTVDTRVPRALGVLGLAVLKLNRSSTELATANIRLTRTYTALTVVILLVGIVQIVLMLRSH
jgi:hypothetical protein